MNELENLATEIRKATLVSMHSAGGGHVGGSMSMADVLAVLYGHSMKIDPKNPNWNDRDWLVVSKGHCGPAVYGALAVKGYFDYELLKTLNQNQTTLPSHCDRNKTIGIDMTTGSLGQGISSAAGVALGYKLLKKKNYVYCILGDGECNEGQVWEAALFASSKKLSNLIVFVDMNKKQLDGYTKDICDLGDLRQKFEEFGFNSVQVDGHNHNEIISAINKAKESQEKPSMIILDTIKGKGCSFAEDVPLNHHIRFTKEQFDQSMIKLNSVKEYE